MTISLIAHAQTPTRGTCRQPPEAGQGERVPATSIITAQRDGYSKKLQACTHCGAVPCGCADFRKPHLPARARALERKWVQPHSEVAR